MTTGATLLLGATGWVESLHVNSRGEVVWSVLEEGGNWRIHLADGQQDTVLAASGMNLSPRINNAAQVVWTAGSGAGNDVVLADPAVGGAPLLLNNAMTDATFPDLNDAGGVVWVEKDAAGSFSLHRYDPAGGVSRLDTGTFPPPSLAPRLNAAGAVAWSRTDPGNPGVYQYTATGTVQLAGAEGGANPGRVALSATGSVVWSGLDVGQRRQLYAASVGATGIPEPVRPWTSTEWDNLFPAINGNGDLAWVQRTPTGDRVLLGVSDPLLAVAPENCNGLDDDRDGQVDEFVATFHYYPDGDGDGFAAIGAALSIPGCNATPPAGATEKDGDCDDTDPQVSPAAAEICNGRDDNCNGVVDEGVLVQTWPDQDGDGYGWGGGTPVPMCPDSAGRAPDASDCDDVSAAIHPGAIETCNRMDDNCNAVIDEGVCNTASNTGSSSGSPVRVAVAPGVDLWFESVLVAGETTLKAVAAAPHPPDSYRFVGETFVFEIQTTADLVGQVWVCAAVPGGSSPQGVLPALLHWDGDGWRDVTLDATPEMIPEFSPAVTQDSSGVCGVLPGLSALGATRLAAAWWTSPPSPAPPAPAAPVSQGGGCALSAAPGSYGALDAGLMLPLIWALGYAVRRRVRKHLETRNKDFACKLYTDW
ncbi:MAG: putative metal-binding motif-containing protein [Nitrospirota bacterium]|nr:putative metal-binding motif-containing protein [Nitrospirota bacterium]